MVLSALIAGSSTETTSMLQPPALPHHLLDYLEVALAQNPGVNVLKHLATLTAKKAMGKLPRTLHFP